MSEQNNNDGFKAELNFGVNYLGLLLVNSLKELLIKLFADGDNCNLFKTNQLQGYIVSSTNDTQYCVHFI